MQYEKVYVGVVMFTDTEGNSKPVEIEWTDGKRFAVAKVLDKRFTPPEHVGSTPTVRYTVIIRGCEKFLYYEKFHNKWFVEKHI